MTPFTLFTCPKAFAHDFHDIQYTALQSWVALGVEVILIGNDPGVAQAAETLKVQHVPPVERNGWGTPLVSDIFAKGQLHAAYHESQPDRVVVYVNADIILLPCFSRAVQFVTQQVPGPFFAVGQRWDAEVVHVDANEPDKPGFEARIRPFASLHQAAGIDYFAFRRGTLGDIPEFALGRFQWDNFLVWNAARLNMPIVDLTAVAFVVHQNHSYLHAPLGDKEATYRGLESQLNTDRARAAGCSRWYTVDDATHRVVIRDGALVLEKKEHAG